MEGCVEKGYEGVKGKDGDVCTKLMEKCKGKG